MKTRSSLYFSNSVILLGVPKLEKKKKKKKDKILYLHH